MISKIMMLAALSVGAAWVLVAWLLGAARILGFI